jgi:lipoate-protein ligase B
MKFIQLGLISYQRALAMQQQLHQEILAGTRGSCVLLLEHPPTITFGKYADPAHLLLPPENLRMQGVELHNSDRGGEITAHMPGQLVVYPLFSFKENRIGVKSYINLLEEVVINTLATFGLSSERDKRNPGIWVRGKKICALGLRISQRIAMHGLALNVANDLSLFNAITPCGLTGCEVTSLAHELERSVALEKVSQVLVAQFAQSLGEKSCAKFSCTKP